MLGVIGYAEELEQYYLPPTPLFAINEYFPPPSHKERIARYRDNRKLFMGQHYDVFKRVQNRLTSRQNDVIYISVNLPAIICKKSADFLFGEPTAYSAGKDDNSNEQKALDRINGDNNLDIINYESALGNAYRGDSFYKIRWGQEYDGMVDARYDPFRAIIEAQNPEYVFPETFPGDANKIMAYHIAVPFLIRDNKKGDYWILNVESHFPGRIIYRKFNLNPVTITYDNEITEWRIYSEIKDAYKLVETDVPFPLVVHVPNFATDEIWEGIDDLSDNKPLFDEINNRLSQIAAILDKHADPAMAVPAGLLSEDEEGNPVFRVGLNKIFEIMGKEDVVPQYITWDGQLQAAFQELEKLIDILLINAEIPAVALGKGDSGTSGSSGLSIKWRMNSILAKINRKRQYYNKGLKRVLTIAQMLEHARGGKQNYQLFTPLIKFRDGLPDDETEMANIMAIRTGGKATISQKSAVMWLDSLTEEQAEKELERIRAEEAVADPSIFNNDTFKQAGGE
ncbi:Phage portal protein, SPP1 Gp6-like [Desulfotomaculum arcticum]|uniref:Phage portal protein, SPP1 Gp6-like n=1 Tax=Desulfotruncus arcticus DSM 17038 TaxID=1121424 RepID=A0A1I2YC13_9FIRM|nr:phage portal protein [Desulfotruncus arcticus]SFH23162.1 Phage portal protein, SPP1 Gp6-like [Desulfotomaculum arcticum] [Desulfotruncus arcticus DSM 17038]